MAGTPFDIDRELLRTGPAMVVQIIIVLPHGWEYNLQRHPLCVVSINERKFLTWYNLSSSGPVELDFSDISLNSMDATGQRDFVGM